MTSKQGFTLIELLVYIVLTSIIVVIAGRAFTDATNQRLRTTRLLDGTMGTGDAIAYLDEDLRRTGSKTWLQPLSSSSAGSSSSSAATMQLVDSVYWSPFGTPPDSSSFKGAVVGTGSTRLDSIEFRTAVYDPQTGKATGSEQIRWSVVNGNLVRQVIARRSTNGSLVSSSTSADYIIIAHNVIEFRVRYGLQTMDSVIAAGSVVYSCPATVSSASSVYTLSLAAGASSASASAGAAGVQMGPFTPGVESVFQLRTCPAATITALNLTPGATYHVLFRLQSNDSAYINFRSDLDYIGVGVRDYTTWSSKIMGTDDFQFYSGLDNSPFPRSFDFTPSGTSSASASLVFNFQMRGSSAGTAMNSAAFSIDLIRVSQVGRPGNDWRDSFPSPQDSIKKYVKAFEVTLAVQNHQAVSTLRKLIPLVNNGTTNK